MGLWGGLFKRKVIEQFVQSAVQGQPAECRIQIAKYLDFGKVLSLALLKQGLPKSEVIRLLDTKFSSVCPQCGMQMTGEDLQWIEAGVIMARGGSKIIGIGVDANKVVRFSQGRCVNEKCSSADILLYWRP